MIWRRVIRNGLRSGLCSSSRLCFANISLHSRQRTLTSENAILGKRCCSSQFAWKTFRTSFCTSSSMSLNEFTNIVDDTLEELADHFDYLADKGFFSDSYDCLLADGVMTAKLGEYGTYVINKQTPNRQIWLSSPVSGPKRYDFVDKGWYYSHEPGKSLHKLLSDELSDLTKQKTDFTHLAHDNKRQS